ncbi:purine-cytosine permease FCY2 [Colletotrichum orchidophilum]|uniref:Purine-cytosine permease FCY2 n=1 Tax=Colletotrichum orchidophilum TaxID=1209926 RepID=A0A1G4AWM5_9PEZI|nr:purine-cytosine permease FCY2 [Colletotrichum orchidophilum]OHE93531.1 purine-cytosine permease FCY2 [Colletotrichum orchidophilum]
MNPPLREQPTQKKRSMMSRAQGIAPIPVEKRVVAKTLTVFTLWWCMNANMLPITVGMLGATYGLALVDSALVIIFFTLLTTMLPAYLSALGPKTGMRQMIQARFSFGRYLIGVPVLLNLATLVGFCVVLAVIGGQCRSAVGRSNAIISFGMNEASYMIPWACLASDFTTYLEPSTSSKSSGTPMSYFVTLNFQLLPTPFSHKATLSPRYVYALLVTAAVIPVGIRAATDFFASLENFIALIVYWSAAFLGVILVEHLWFRGADCARYVPDAWDDAARLLPGVAAFTACVLCFSIVVPSMAQVWWIGPIAETNRGYRVRAGGCGVWVAVLVFRSFERRISGQ